MGASVYPVTGRKRGNNMYYKVKSVAFNKKEGKIYVTCTDSSLSSLHYNRSEYAAEEKDFVKKCNKFWISVLSANFQFIPSNKWNEAVNYAYEKMNNISCNMDIFEKDYEYRTSFYEELKEYVAKTYLVPLVTKETKQIDYDYEYGFVDKCRVKWNEVEEQRLRDNQISIRSALFSDVFPGWTALYSRKGEQLILAKSSNYDNRGLLDNTDNSAIILPEGSAKQWRKIAWARFADLPDILKGYPQLVAACTVEADYQSEERAKMDGYEKVFESDEHCLYAKETDKHKCTYAKITGFC